MSQDTIGDAPPRDYAPEEDSGDVPHKPHTIRNAFIGAAAVFAAILAIIYYPLATATFAGGVACALIYKPHVDRT